MMNNNGNTKNFQARTKEHLSDLGYTLRENWKKTVFGATLVTAAAVAIPNSSHMSHAEDDIKNALLTSVGADLILETNGVKRAGLIFMGHAQKVEQDNPQDNLALLDHEPATCLSVTARVIEGKENLPLAQRVGGANLVTTAIFNDPSYDNSDYFCLPQQLVTVDEPQEEINSEEVDPDSSSGSAALDPADDAHQEFKRKLDEMLREKEREGTGFGNKFPAPGLST